MDEILNWLKGNSVNIIITLIALILLWRLMPESWKDKLVTMMPWLGKLTGRAVTPADPTVPQELHSEADVTLQMKLAQLAAQLSGFLLKVKKDSVLSPVGRMGLVDLLIMLEAPIQMYPEGPDKTEALNGRLAMLKLLQSSAASTVLPDPAEPNVAPTQSKVVVQ